MRKKNVLPSKRGILGLYSRRGPNHLPSGALLSSLATPHLLRFSSILSLVSNPLSINHKNSSTVGIFSLFFFALAIFLMP